AQRGRTDETHRRRHHSGAQERGLRSSGRESARRHHEYPANLVRLSPRVASRPRRLKSAMDERENVAVTRDRRSGATEGSKSLFVETAYGSKIRLCCSCQRGNLVRPTKAARHRDPRPSRTGGIRTIS